MASSSSAALSPATQESPYSRYDVLEEAALRCDELRRMTDEDFTVASSKKRARPLITGAHRNIDVPDIHLMETKPFGNWWKARYSKAAIRLIQFGLMSNLTFICGMPFIVPMRSSAQLICSGFRYSHVCSDGPCCSIVQAAVRCTAADPKYHKSLRVCMYLLLLRSSVCI